MFSLEEERIALSLMRHSCNSDAYMIVLETFHEVGLYKGSKFKRDVRDDIDNMDSMTSKEFELLLKCIATMDKANTYHVAALKAIQEMLYWKDPVGTVLNFAIAAFQYNSALSNNVRSVLTGVAEYNQSIPPNNRTVYMLDGYTGEQLAGVASVTTALQQMKVELTEGIVTQKFSSEVCPVFISNLDFLDLIKTYPTKTEAIVAAVSNEITRVAEIEMLLKDSGTSIPLISGAL